MEKRIQIRSITEGSLAVALATVLSLIVVYKMPQGGSITAGSMVPIIFYSLRWGAKKGILAGGVFGLINFMISPYFYSPIQFLLDYILAYGLLGLAGIFSSKEFSIKNVILGSSLGILARAISHILAGVFFFAEYAGDMNPWVYSGIYNASYLVPELIISIIVISILYKPLTNILSKVN